MDNDSYIKKTVIKLMEVEEYSKAVTLCESIKNSQTMESRWFSYFHIAKCFYFMKEYELCIYNTLISTEYVQIEVENYRSLWMAAVAYEEMGQLDKTLSIYEDILNETTIQDIRASILHNKAKILNDENLMLQSIDLYIECELYSHLDNAYDNLTEIYISKNNHIKAYQTIKKIKDRSIRERLLNQLTNFSNTKVTCA